MILGLPWFIWGGITGFVLLVIQVLGGLKIIKMPYKTHRIIGITILVIALVHGSAALLFWFRII